MLPLTFFYSDEAHLQTRAAHNDVDALGQLIDRYLESPERKAQAIQYAQQVIAISDTPANLMIDYRAMQNHLSLFQRASQGNQDALMTLRTLYPSTLRGGEMLTVEKCQQNSPLYKRRSII